MAADKALSLNNGLPAIRNWSKEKFIGKEAGKGLSENDFTTALKEKLEGIEAGANKYVHPAHTARAAGLYKVTVDASGHITNVEAVTKEDITALGIPGQDTNTTYAVVTQNANGLMKKEDKVKLDGIEDGANNYEHPVHEAKASGLYKVTVDEQGHISAVTTVTKADITALGIPGQDTNTTYANFKAATAAAAGGNGLVPAPPAGAQAKFMRGDGTWQTPPNTTYSPATASSNGLMTKEDFAKLAAFQSAGNYALKSELANIYKYRGSVANEAALPTTGLVAGYVYNIEAKSSYGPAGTNVAWTEEGTWDNLGGNFVIDYATAAEVLAVLNA